MFERFRRRTKSEGQPTINSVDLLWNKEFMDQFTRDLYTDVSAKYQTTITATTAKTCDVLNGHAAKKLRGEHGITAKFFVKRGAPWKTPQGSIHHAFLVMWDESRQRNIVVDFSYKQFIAAGHYTTRERQGRRLPDYLVIPWSTDEELVQGLQRHKIDQKYYNDYRLAQPEPLPADLK